MAISFVNSNTNTNAGSTAVSVTKPTNTTAGDVVIFFVHSNADPSCSDNNGSTPATLKYSVNEIGPTGTSLFIWYRVCGASEPATYNFTLGSSQRWVCSALTYRGVHNASPFDVDPSSSSRNTANSTTTSTKSITTINYGSMVIAVGYVDSATSTFTATPGDSFNSRVNSSGTQLTGIADKLLTTATTQAAVSWTLNPGSDWYTNIFALRQGGIGSLFYSQL